jgi:hypothetical protein
MPGECIHAEILIKEVDEFEIAFYINNVILISYWLSHVSRARRSQDFRCASRDHLSPFLPKSLSSHILLHYCHGERNPDPEALLPK